MPTLLTTRNLLLAGAALPLLAAPIAALADPAAAPSTGADQTTASGSSTNTGVSSVEAVVVTARKRSERLVDAPVAATVLDRSRVTLYNSTDITSIGNQIVGVNLVQSGQGGSGASLSIRGVGNAANDYGTEQPVAIVIDGMPLTRGHVTDVAQFDLQNVQVFKGPQALFFGKNSPAGVVELDSASPGHTFSGYARVTYGFAFQTPAIEGAVSIPINDTLSIRLAARFSDMLGGYSHNDARAIADPFPGERSFILPGAAYQLSPGTEQEGYRGTVLWTPNDRFTATWKTEYAFFRNRGGANNSEVEHCPAGASHPVSSSGGTVVPDPFSNCTLDGRSSIGNAPPQILAGFYPFFNANEKPYNKSSTTISTLKLEYKLPHVTLTSVTGFYVEAQNAFDNFDGTVYGQAIDYQNDVDTTYSEELRANSTFDGPLNFTVGAYFEHESLDILNTDKIAALASGALQPGTPAVFRGVAFPEPPLAFQTHPIWQTAAVTYANRNRTYSGFGELQWKILPNLELDGGARYTREDKTTNVDPIYDRFDYILGPTASPFAPQGIIYSPAEHESNVSPEVTLTWHPVQNVTLYGAYKTGFLSGGAQNSGTMPNITSSVCAPGVPVAPGCQKATIYNRNIPAENASLQYNPETASGEEFGAKAILFDGRFSGDLTFYRYTYSNLQVITFHAATTTYSIANAGSALDQGVEGQGRFQVDDHLTIRGMFEYSRLKYVNFTGAPCYAGETAAAGCTTILNTVPPTGAQNLSGQAYGGPPWAISGGFVYDHPMFEGLNATLTMDAYWYASTPLVNREPLTNGAAYTIVNASLKIYKPDAHWDVSLIGTNLTNSFGAHVGGDKPLGKTGTITSTIIPGREVTIQAAYHF